MAVTAMIVVSAGCGSSDGDSSSPSATTTTAEAPATTVADTTTTNVATTTTSTTSTTLPATTSTTTTTTTPTTTTEPVPTTTTTLPGEPYEYAIAGTVGQVAGVAFDETFDLQALPGEDQPIAASLPALTEFVLTGEGRQIDQGSFFRVWFEVATDDAVGWISKWSVVYLGAPRGLTADTIDALGEVPTAPTMIELGQIVTDAIVQPDPDFPPATVVLAAEPSDDTNPVVIYDGFPGEDFGSDVDLGSRYLIVGRQLGPDSYELVSVEAASLCTRGVESSTGYCV